MTKKGDQFLSAGFTLTEMLIVLVIFLLIVVVIYSSLALSQQVYRRGEEAAEITQNGRVILERMTREIRQAKEMVTELADTEAEATSTIEFEDGHIPSVCPDVGSEYYYIRYYLVADARELRRQCRVYCFDPCDVCSSYHRWNATQDTTSAHPCVLEDRTIGEYVAGLGFWGRQVINASTTLEKNGKLINLRTKIYGRNL